MMWLFAEGKAKFTFKKKQDKRVREKRKFGTRERVVCNGAHFWRFCKWLIYRMFFVMQRIRGWDLRQLTASFAANDAPVCGKRRACSIQTGVSGSTNQGVKPMESAGK